MPPAVSALVLNYNASEEALRACIEAIDNSTSDDLLEIVIAENGSTEHRDAAVTVASGIERARVVNLGNNWGFAGGINRGLKECRGEWVLILNNDTEIDAGALSALSASLDRQPPECVAVVPKLLFMSDRHVIDAVGNAIDKAGQAFNLGIGQLDVGQYDRPERVFGPCFAAGLFRKAAFDDEHVGPLDESYFMYYEDVDWNWRANLFGYTFVTVPEARVYHVHSGSTRALAYEFKYRHIERNLLASVLKNFEGRRAVRIWVRRYVSLTRNVVRGHHGWTSIRIMFEAAVRLPDTWRKRMQVRARRKLSDTQIIRFSRGEHSYYDPPKYAPLYDVVTLVAMYRRKYAITGDRRYLEILQMARALDRTPLRFEPGYLTTRLGPLLEGEPECIFDFLKKVEEL
jgi:GT2 family glycosyltransferase